MPNKIKLLWDMTKELKLKLYQFIKPTCELEMRSQASCRSLLPEGCVLSISLLRTKPRGLVWLDP